MKAGNVARGGGVELGRGDSFQSWWGYGMHVARQGDQGKVWAQLRRQDMRRLFQSRGQMACYRPRLWRTLSHTPRVQTQGFLEGPEWLPGL